MAAPRWGAGRSGQPRWVRSAAGASHRLLNHARLRRGGWEASIPPKTAGNPGFSSGH